MTQLTNSRQSETSLLGRLERKIRSDFLTNWRLALLGLTGIALSVASGWTTFDGLNNFTKSPFLCLMITFGIQGVMLVTAWLIGESFATSLARDNHPSDDKEQKSRTIIQWSIFIVLILVSTTAILAFAHPNIFGLTDFEALKPITQFATNFGVPLIGVLVLVALLTLFSKTKIIRSYAHGLKTILTHLPLWTMFLACMATSVFFSFDSLFSTIFPVEERQRAGSLRAQSQISGLLSDLEKAVTKNQEQKTAKFFSSAAWKDYEQNLEGLNNTLRNAAKEVSAERQRQTQQNEEKRKKNTAHQATVRANKAALDQDYNQHRAALTRLQEKEEKQSGEIERIEKERQQKRSETARKKAQAEAEISGVGDTGRAGAGPIYRKLQKEIARQEIEIKGLNTQLESAETNLKKIRQQKTQIRAALTSLNHKRALLTAELRVTGDPQIAANSQVPGLDETLSPNLDPNRLALQLAAFRREPTKNALIKLQQTCARTHEATLAVPPLNKKVSNLSCDPKKVNDLAGGLFALGTRAKDYHHHCGGTAAIPQNDIDSQLRFARQCIQRASLPADSTKTVRSALNHLALARDDKAHRFVVTWNAFSDGNQLAYLALAIAIAVDGLVFMSGLFGAQATSSPLSEAPAARDRPAAKLEEIIDNALLPDPATATALFLNALQPVQDEQNPEIMARINLTGLVDHHYVQIKKILTAGASLGLVRPEHPNQEQYLIATQLYEHVSSIRAREAKLGDLGQDTHPRYRDLAPPMHQSQSLGETNAQAYRPTLAARRQTVRLLERPQPTASPDHIAAELLKTLKIKPQQLKKARQLCDSGLHEYLAELLKTGELQRAAHIELDITKNLDSLKEKRHRLLEQFPHDQDTIDCETKKMEELITTAVALVHYDLTIENAQTLSKRVKQKTESAAGDIKEEADRLLSNIEEAKQAGLERWFDLDEAIARLSTFEEKVSGQNHNVISIERATH